MWEHNSLAGNIFDKKYLYHCVYCNSSLRESIRGRKEEHEIPWFSSPAKPSFRTLSFCDTCGWWVVSFNKYKEEAVSGGMYWENQTYRAYGALKRLDVADTSIPIIEVRKHLSAKYGDRFDVDPIKFENIVASVFADFGYRVRTTSINRDDGVDIFAFDGSGDSEIAIQVKRWKGKIQSTNIREFAGSLLVNNKTTGIYVTTSSFTAGAKDTAKRCEPAVSIQLMDADRFYDPLSIANREKHPETPSKNSIYYSILNGEDLISCVHFENGTYD